MLPLHHVLSHPAATHRAAVDGVVARSANHAAMRAAAVRRALDSRVSDCSGGLGHCAAGTVCGVAWGATPCGSVVGAPAGLAGEDSVVEAVEGIGAGAVDEGSVADEGDVVN